MMEKVLSLENVTKKFGEFKAVDDVSLEIEKGVIILLIGPNGSGKTTLINSISGIYKPDSGKVFFYGEDITSLPTHEIVERGLVRTFQIASAFGALTVLENLLVSYGKNQGEALLWSFFKKKWLEQEEDATKRAYEVLKLLELMELYDQPANTLSGGQLKLLEIGKALMTDAKMILADEPAGSISVPLAKKIFSHIWELNRRQGIDILMSEHRLDVAIDFVDYVYAMDRGRIISCGTPKEVFNDPFVIKSYLGGI